MKSSPDSSLTEAVIGAAMEVHRHLGPGLLESAYQKAMEKELTLRELPYRAQVSCPVEYKGESIGDAYRMDLIVADQLVVELKAVSSFDEVHEAQLLSYLRFSGASVGLLINFHKRLLKEGLRRYSM